MTKKTLITILTISSLFIACGADSKVKVKNTDDLKSTSYKFQNSFEQINNLTIKDDKSWSIESIKGNKVTLINNELIYYKNDNVFLKSKIVTDFEGIIKQSLSEYNGRRVSTVNILMSNNITKDICDNNFATQSARDYLFFNQDEIFCFNNLDGAIKQYYLDRFKSIALIKKYNLLGKWQDKNKNIWNFNEKGAWSSSLFNKTESMKGTLIIKERNILNLKMGSNKSLKLSLPITQKNGCILFKSHNILLCKI